MALINVADLSFTYDGSYYPVFDHVGFSIDSSWKLGLIGRNGKGKTTLLNLLMGKYGYQGSITSSVRFDYFPYDVSESDLGRNTEELIMFWYLTGRRSRCRPGASLPGRRTKRRMTLSLRLRMKSI